MNGESSSSTEQFTSNDLIWAKMKGFPPWPAKVMPQSEDTPNGRVPVMFFGTGETAFIKPSDCCSYLDNKHQYEVPRKHKGFNEGVHEIRVSAGIESPSFRDPIFFPAPESSKGESSPFDQERQRRTSNRMLADAFLDGFRRQRSNSGSTKTRSRASSTASALKHLHKQLNKRRRLDSESSNGSRRKAMISGGLDTTGLGGLFDNFPPFEGGDWPGLGDDGILGLADDARSTRSKRSRGSSKVFEDYILGGLGTSGRNRYRSGSANGEGRRSRLISGVSDVFEDLLYNGDVHAAAEQLLQTLDDIPSESSEVFPQLLDRPGTPEAPAPLPRPNEFCKKCGNECQLFGNRWRCSAKYCLEWNGVAGGIDQPCTSSSFMNSQPTKSHPMDLDLKPVLQTVKPEPEDQKPVTMASKKDRPTTNKPVVAPAKKKGKEKKEEKMPKIKIKREAEEETTTKKKSARDRIREEFEMNDRHLATSAAPKEKKKVQVVSPRQISLSPPTSPTRKSPMKSKSSTDSPLQNKRAQGRPKQYKVEKTPPVSKTGMRHCSFCNGQVRPQMCGGNKHRWRCVDKKCRKWYGWVKSSDEIPTDLGRKGRYNSVLGKIKLKKKDKPRTKPTPSLADEALSVSSAGEAAAAAAQLDTASLMSDNTGRSSPLRAAFLTLAEMKKQKVAKAQHQAEQAALAARKAKDRANDAKNLKRKYSKKDKQRDSSVAKEEEELPKRPLSPLTQREMRYRPCGMEKRSRWWLSEKRRADPSPERELQTGAADAAAAFRILSHAFRAAAVTRADEVGTVNGSLDLLMDSLLGCMGPLLSLLAKLPNTRPDPQVVQQLWDASAVHMPMFQ